MHYGNNENIIMLNCVKNGIREYINQTSANVLLHNPPTLGCGDDFCDGNPDLTV